MHPFPHLYSVSASAAPAGSVQLSSPGVASLSSDGPVEFDGPGGQWSPETLLTAAMADCFVLSFRAVAAASRFGWTSLQAEVAGTLDRIERITQFTHFRISARLQLPAGADEARARILLEKAEKVCLISSSVKATRQLEIEVSSAP